MLSIRAELLQLRNRGNQDTWRGKGFSPYLLEADEMQAVRAARIRPGAREGHVAKGDLAAPEQKPERRKATT